MLGEKQFFKGVDGFATTKGKRVYVSSALAKAIEWPWAKGAAVLDLVDEPVVEVFDYNGRPLNGLSHFSTEFKLIFADTIVPPQPTIPVVALPHTMTFPQSLPATLPFTDLESLRRLWRHAITRPDGPFSLALYGVIESGKWKPNGRAKSWFSEPIEIDGLLVQSVKTSWIFLETDIYIQELRPGATIRIGRIN